MITLWKMVQQPMEQVVTLENLEAEEGFKMRKGNERLTTLEELLQRDKKLTTGANKIDVMKGKVQERRKEKGLYQG